jgi:hypothetical protein
MPQSSKCAILAIGLTLMISVSCLVVEVDPLDEKEDTSDLRKQARRLLKRRKSVRKTEDPWKSLKIGLKLPDYRNSAAKDPIIRRMKRAINKFNNDPDTDSAMGHFGEAGTFVWLQGRRPLQVYGPDCFSRIIKENKEEDEDIHLGFFGKFFKNMRIRMKSAHGRQAHARNARILLKKRIQAKRRTLQANKKMLKERILSTQHQKSTLLNRKKQKDAIVGFLHRRRSRKAMGIPAQAMATIDDSYIHITSFARPPEQQSSLVRSPDDNTTQVVQVRVKIPPKNYHPKKEKKPSF